MSVNIQWQGVPVSNMLFGFSSGTEKQVYYVLEEDGSRSMLLLALSTREGRQACCSETR